MNTSSQEKQQISSILCANSCGFYGSATTRNLCSKCYRNALLLEQQKQQASSPQLPDKLTSVDTARAHLSNSSSNDPCCVSNETTVAKTSRVLTSNNTEPCITTLSQSIHQPSASSSMCPVDESSMCGVIDFASNYNTDHRDSDLIPVTSNPNESISVTTLSQSIISSCHTASHSNPLSSFLSQPTAPLVSEESESSSTVQVNKTRCYKCNKRIGLLGFQCRCDFYFCTDHRHADCHDCSFDYKALGRQQISKANKKIVAEKLNRI